jgi:hypothetical protein
MRTSANFSRLLNADAIVARSGYAHPPDWEKFRGFYRNQELTNCLEVFSQEGFEGDEAIFLLNWIGGES